MKSPLPGQITPIAPKTHSTENPVPLWDACSLQVRCDLLQGRLVTVRHTKDHHVLSARLPLLLLHLLLKLRQNVSDLLLLVTQVSSCTIAECISVRDRVFSLLKRLFDLLSSRE